MLDRPASVFCALVFSIFWLAGMAALDRACAQNVINPDFALPSAAGTSQGIIVDPATSPQIGWTFTSTSVPAPTSSGVQQNGSAFGPPAAPNGKKQTAYINNLGTISQNIDFKQAGDYTLSFYIAARAGGLPTGSFESITVTIGGQQYGPYKPQSSSSFDKITIPFTIEEANPSVELKFAGCGLGGSCAVQTGEVTTDFLAQMEIAAVAPQITKGPTDIDPTSKIELTGEHFGPDKGTIRIHFPSASQVAFQNKSPHGKSKSDLYLDVPGKWGDSITSEALDSASAVGAPDEQPVEITVIAANGASSNVWKKANFHNTPVITGVLPTSITPSQSFNVTGWDFGADTGAVMIHFSNNSFHSSSLDSKDNKDAQIDKGKWTPSVVEATVPKDVTAVVEQDVDISLTPKGGKASDARKENFNPTMVVLLAPASVAQCGNETTLDLCNPGPGSYSGSALGCLNPVGDFQPGNSIEGFHMACYGFASDNGQDIYGSFVAAPWWTITEVDYEDYPPLSPGVWANQNNSSMEYTLGPSALPFSAVFVTVNWHIGASGGTVAYVFDVWMKGPAGVPFQP